MIPITSRRTGVIVTGDLALWDGQTKDYETLLTLLEPIRKAGLPLHLALGNHDHRERFREAIRGHLSRIAGCTTGTSSRCMDPTCGFVMLDSLFHTAGTPGILGHHQLDWLALHLDAHPDIPTLVCLHHDPTPGSDKGLLDTKRFYEIVRPRKQVKAIVFGHTHAWSVKLDESSGIHLVNLPAVAYKFGIEQPLGWCRFTPQANGGLFELRLIGGNREVKNTRYDVEWRSA